MICSGAFVLWYVLLPLRKKASYHSYYVCCRTVEILVEFSLFLTSLLTVVYNVIIIKLASTALFAPSEGVLMENESVRRGKFLFATILCAILCFTLVACNGDDGIKINGWLSGGNSRRPITIMDAGRDYKNLIALVKEKYPEIDVQVVPYNGSNMSAYMKRQLTSGSMPDIYTTTQEWDVDLQQKNLLDLSCYGVTEKYNAARLNDISVGGEVYLLPYDYSIFGVTYNKSLFERLNIAVPTSFEQLETVTVPALKNAGVNLSLCLTSLPGYAFQYYFNVASTSGLNTLQGKKWKADFIDVNKNVYSESFAEKSQTDECFQKWIDLGLINRNSGRTGGTKLLQQFTEGNTAFLFGSVSRFSQNADGSGDKYDILPYLSQDGKTNVYITQPGRCYGLNKKLGEKQNKQKLTDALHFLEVLSTVEGYEAVIGENNTLMCSLKDYQIADDSPYKTAVEYINMGHCAELTYSGWENYIFSIGEELEKWICGANANNAWKVADGLKRKIQAEGVTTYGEVVEELDTRQLSILCGQTFAQAAKADGALISRNVYYSDVDSRKGNAYGVNGKLLKGLLTEEDLTIFLPTGWYGNVMTAQLTREQILEYVNGGVDVRNSGRPYPYVFVWMGKRAVTDEQTYTVVLCGYDADWGLQLTDSGVLGLDATKQYFAALGQISSASINEDAVLFETPESVYFDFAAGE